VKSLGHSPASYMVLITFVNIFKPPSPNNFPSLLANRNHYTIASYKAMLWQFLWWSREASNDATSVCQVEGPSSFYLLFCCGWSIGSTRGFGWVAKAILCLLIRSWMAVLKFGICRSVWRVWLVTYQGALAMVRRNFDWYLCMIAISDLLAQPHSSMP
jgi:hypothetical protein